MKNVKQIPGGAIMFLMIFFCFIGCGTHNLKYTQPKPYEAIINVMPIVSIPMHADTPKLVLSNIETEIRHLSNQNKTLPIDVKGILELNAKWQELGFRLIDSTRHRKKITDSTKFQNAILNSKLDSAIRIGNKTFNQSQKDREYYNQYKTLTTGVDWQIYIAFTAIIILLLLNAYITSRIRKHQQKNLTYL